MKKMKRSACFILYICLCISLLSGISGECFAQNEIYLAFTSDVHTTSSSSEESFAATMNDWLDGVSATLGIDQFDTFCVNGDLGSGSASKESVYWSYCKAVIDNADNNSHVKSFVCIPGNHEWSDGKIGSSSNSVAKKYTLTDNVIVKDGYVLYCMGADSSSQSISTSQITALGNYLKTAPADVPIIVLSHYPLHTYSNRSTTNASSVISVLNEYAATRKIVFIWGHNHTINDTHYDNIYTEQIDEGTSIDFVYAAAGCMSWRTDSNINEADYEEYTDESAYNGSGGGSSSASTIKGRGLVLRIVGNNVSLWHYGDSYTAINEYVEETPVTIALNHSSATLYSGEYGSRMMLRADLEPAGDAYEVIYSSSDEDIVTVDTNGIINSVGAGTAVVTAKEFSSGAQAQCEVTVLEETLQCVSVPGNSVGEGAFSLDASVSSVTLSMGAVEIASQAFSGCTGLIEILIPSSVTAIAPDAFSVRNPDLRILCTNGSTAYNYARAHGIDYVLID